MSSERIVDSLDPADAFAALSDPKRVDILEALWRADDQTATFSELREAADIRDSGQFNYHLTKLADRFVRKGEDGYRLTLAGRHVVGSLLVGAYTTSEGMEPVPLDDPCPFCGGTWTFHYEDERVRIDCEECGLGIDLDVPPGVFAGYDREAAPDVAKRYVRLQLRTASHGFCPLCEYRIEPRVVEPEDTGFADVEFPLVHYTCERCGEEVIAEVGTALVEHPSVVAFFYDHGVDVEAAPLSQFVATDDRSEVRRRDPLEVAVSFECEDETLTVVVDEQFRVLSTDRS
ncbi:MULTISPECIES: winged helix-turn-helix domain-containing protein [Salinibaculum]|uniref:winged helix-turn-helix domain-containing protein n=1 Tax=Salinibaculum TaxID=2732368 RepID=UPI0030D14A97